MTSPSKTGYFRQEWFIKSRVILAQIRSVNTKKGTVSVTLLDDLNLGENDLEVPVIGFSVQGFHSSWIRYMPQVFDLVYIAFSPKNEPRIIAMATDVGEYGAISNIENTAPKKFPHADFIELKQGEWDQRSSGGAYIHGTRDGALLLSAGPMTQLRFDKVEVDARGRTGLWVFESAGSFLRLGDVKRMETPLSFAESDQSLLDPLATKEAWLHLESPPTVPGQPATWLVDEQSGAVRGTDGVAITSSQGQNLRHRKRIFALGATGLAPTTAYVEEIDVLGNKRIEHAVTTTNVEVAAPLAANSESYLSHEVNASTTATLHGGAQVSVTSDALVQLEATLVQLGQNATEASVHGTTFLIHYGTLFGAVATFAGLVAANPTPAVIAAAASTLASTLSAVAAQLAIPPGPGGMLSSKVLVE